MNCDKSTAFLEKWNANSDKIKRSLTEFSLQLTPVKFADMINYKKNLLDNLQPSDIEMTVLSTGAEVYEKITDSKMKSLCLSKSSELIKLLEFSMKNPDESKTNDVNAKISAFVSNLEIKNSAFGTNVKVLADFGGCTVVCNDTTITGIKFTDGLSFDVLTFNEGFSHTFVLRFELNNGDMYSFYSAISRGGAKGEKPKVFASAFIDGYYSSIVLDELYIY